MARSSSPRGEVSAFRNTTREKRDIIMDLRLTPAGSLRPVPSPEDEGPDAASAIREAFHKDWREGLFTLAAGKYRLHARPVLQFWQDFAIRYLTGLCHIPGETQSFNVPAPSPTEHAERALTAPPMQGGEYLSGEILIGIWKDLDRWVHQAVAAATGLDAFLQRRAPKWHAVGRVCFHLAENKADPVRPFAFLATYATGFGTGGQLKHVPLRNALEQYAGDRNRPALIKLLTPVERASERLSWVKALVDSSEIYHPLAWSAERAYQFLQSAPTLEESGLSVRLPNWWQKRMRPRVTMTIGNRRKATLGAEAVLDFDLRVALDGASLTVEELETLLAGPDGLVSVKGQWVEVDREKLEEAIAQFGALKAQAETGGISFIEGMRLLAGASPDLKSEDRAEETRPWVHVTAGVAMQEILAGLRSPETLAAVKPGNGLNAELRPYQREGLSWLHFLTRLGLGACLADDMGLGKTLQVLALLLCERGSAAQKPHRPSLLVVPASLLGNWRNEANRFTPSLKLVFVHPAETDRTTLASVAENPEPHLSGADLVVTTYSMVARQEWLGRMAFHLVILDEAQAIKNPGTRQSRAVKKLNARARIVLTGTPVENRLGDLWSLFDFINPGLLGSATRFKSFIKGLESREENSFAPLRRLVGPYILRRLKTDKAIIADLPEKTEILRYCHLTRPQVKLYEQTVRAMEKAMESSDGMARRGLVLQTLMRLKQICNHPSQFSGDGRYDAGHSGKFIGLAEICEELAQRQEKVLIFTQFREIIDPLSEHLAEIFGRRGLILHGQTAVKERRAIVDRFQEEDGPPFFILSLKAGGTGLNLTAAAHVIHFDRWWNPAVENQATDRSFRIGQKHNVFVHKFVTRGTVEERIDRLIEGKRKLADEVLSGGGEINITELPDAELLALVRLDVTRASL